MARTNNARQQAFSPGSRRVMYGLFGLHLIRLEISTYRHLRGSNHDLRSCLSRDLRDRRQRYGSPAGDTLIFVQASR